MCKALNFFLKNKKKKKRVILLYYTLIGYKITKKKVQKSTFVGINGVFIYHFCSLEKLQGKIVLENQSLKPSHPPHFKSIFNLLFFLEGPTTHLKLFMTLKSMGSR